MLCWTISCTSSENRNIMRTSRYFLLSNVLFTQQYFYCIGMEWRKRSCHTSQNFRQLNTVFEDVFPSVLSNQQWIANILESELIEGINDYKYTYIFRWPCGWNWLAIIIIIIRQSNIADGNELGVNGIGKNFSRILLIQHFLRFFILICGIWRPVLSQR